MCRISPLAEGNDDEEALAFDEPRALARESHGYFRRRRHCGDGAFKVNFVAAQRKRNCHRRANDNLRIVQQPTAVTHARRLDLTLQVIVES